MELNTGISSGWPEDLSSYLMGLSLNAALLFAPLAVEGFAALSIATTLRLGEVFLEVVIPEY
jgi:hypothetical protein